MRMSRSAWSRRARAARRAARTGSLACQVPGMACRARTGAFTGLPPFGKVEVGTGGEAGGHRPPVAVPRVRGAGRAVPDRAARVLDGAFTAAGALTDADQGEADTGLPDDRDQPRTIACGVPVEPVEQVRGPADVMPGVLVGPVEVEHVDNPEGQGAARLHGVRCPFTGGQDRQGPGCWQAKDRPRAMSRKEMRAGARARGAR